MKILVFSDSHNNTGIMNDIVKKYNSEIDCIIHLGDCTDDKMCIRDRICPAWCVTI